MFDLTRRLAVTLVIALCSVATQATAAAAPQECNAVRNQNVRAGAVSIQVKLGDFIVLKPDNTGPSGTVDVTFFGAAPVAVNFPTALVAAQDGVITFTQNAGGAIISCTRTNSIAVLLHIRTQAQSIQLAVIANLRSRWNGGGNTASRDQIYVSTRNLPGANAFETPEFNAWMSLQWRHFSGGSDGHSADLTFGLDRFINPDLLVGGYFAYGQSEMTTGTTILSANSPAFGIYASRRLGQGLFLDGTLGVARPRVKVGTGRFTSTRYTASLQLSGETTLGALTVSPFVSVLGTLDQQPAYTGTLGAVAADDVKSVTASLGARFEPTMGIGPGNAWQPWLSVAWDHGSLRSNTGRDTFDAPRIGLGISGAWGTGELSLEADAGKIGSTTRDVGLSMFYEWRF